MPRNVSQAGMPSKQLLPLPIATPGSLGLNLQEQNSILDPKWSIEAANAVIDQNGRVAARGGLTAATTTPASGDIRTIFEQRTSTGGTTTIVAWDGGISASITAPGTDLVGTIASTASGRWYFVNFLNKAIGFQAGQKPIVRTSGTFSNIVESSGSAPTGGVGTAAYGRVWGMASDGFTLKFSALTDETNWGSGDSGAIDLRQVWPQGMDTVTAIQAFNGTLAIFGTRQIIFYGSTDPTVLGLDVTQLQVVDAVEGVGCISQWSIALIGGEIESSDLIFASLLGIQSLHRLLINQSRPISQLSKHVRDALILQLSSETPANITGFYSPTNGFYALSLPNSGFTWVADMRHRFQDDDGDDVARITRWPIAPLTMIEISTRTVYMSNLKGVVATYGEGSDYGTNFQFILQLPWMDLGQDFASRLKALKRVGALIYFRETLNVTFSWFVDFNIAAQGAAVRATPATSTNAEWGIGQWGISEWSGGTLLAMLNADASGEGQYFSLSITAMVDSQFAVQQANLLAKVLRLA